MHSLQICRIISPMAPTKTLARLLGPSLIVTVLAEHYNGDIFRDNTPVMVFLNGNILFVAGLAVVQAHNVWTSRSAALVSLVGWSALVLGLARMLNPAGSVKVDLEEGWEGMATVAGVCLVGGALIYVAYT